MSLIELPADFDQDHIRKLRHQLAGHPLMTTDEIAELALRIEPRYVRFHDGERSFATNMSDMLQTDPTRQTLRKAVENLHKAKAFVQIINVRADPKYRALVDAFLDEVVAHLPPDDRALLNRDAAAFLASPGSVTPFHLDHEQNFLCHIRGKKILQVWDHLDRNVVTDRALEIFFREGTLREVIYQEPFASRAQVFDLQPGDTVFMPMGSPHAVRTGDEIAVTFSVLLNSASSMQVCETYKANHLLRRLGLKPRPVGESQMRDTLKRRGLVALRRLRDLAKGKQQSATPRWY